MIVKTTEVMPHLKPLTLAGLVEELRKEKKATQDAARAQDRHRITLANDLAEEVSKFASANGIPTSNESVDENVYTFDAAGGSAFVRAIAFDEYEVSTNGTQYRPGDKRETYLFILKRLGLKV